MYVLMHLVQSFNIRFMTSGIFKKWKGNAGSTSAMGPIINRVLVVLMGAVWVAFLNKMRETSV